MSAIKTLTMLCLLGLSLVACSSSSKTDGGDGDSEASSDAGSAEGETSDTGDAANQLQDGVAGKACESDEDCGGEGADCASRVGALSLGGFVQTPGNDTPEGYCTTDCLNDSQCGEGALCGGSLDLSAFASFIPGASMEPTPGNCFERCEKPEDCSQEDFLCVEPMDDQGAGGTGGAPFDLGAVFPSNVCVPSPGDPSQLEGSSVGEACSAPGDCGEGYCARKLGGSEIEFTGAAALLGIGTGPGQDPMPAPGGYCTGRCLEDVDCGEGAICEGEIISALSSALGYCYLPCEQESDCDERDGYYCRPVPVASLMGGVAPSRNACIADQEPLPDGVAGSSCSGDSDCGPGTCDSSVTTEVMFDNSGGGFAGGGFGGGGMPQAMRTNTAAPGGYCSQTCSDALDCGAGATCLSVQGQFSACYATCDQDSDCRVDQGYGCLPSPVGAGGGGGFPGGGQPTGGASQVCMPTGLAPMAQQPGEESMDAGVPVVPSEEQPSDDTNTETDPDAGTSGSSDGGTDSADTGSSEDAGSVLDGDAGVEASPADAGPTDGGA